MRYLIYQLINPLHHLHHPHQRTRALVPCAPCSIRPRTTNDAWTRMSLRASFVPLPTISLSHPTTEQPAPTYFDIDILIRLYRFRTVVLVRLWWCCTAPSLSLCLCACASLRGPPGSAVVLRRGPRRPRGPYQDYISLRVGAHCAA